MHELPVPPIPALISTCFLCLPSVLSISFVEQELVDAGEARNLTIFASTAPPKNTMCLLRGGSSMRTLNFYKHIVSVS